MLLLGKLSIRRRLTVVTTLATSAALLSSSAAFIVYDVVDFRTNRVRRLGTVAEILAYNGTSALVFRDDEAALRTLAALKAEPHVVGAAFYSRDGRRFASYQAPGTADEAPLVAAAPPAVSGHRFAGERVLVFRPVWSEGAPMGSVLVVSDLDEIGQRVRRYAVIVGLVSLAAFAVALLVSSRLQGAIAGPILQLADVARVVSRDKDYSARARPGGGGELGLLVDTFNEMLAEIQKRDEELSEARTDLERRVEQRTAEIHHLNERLAWRAKELEVANRDLESFSYSVSHDLRTPLRAIDGFSMALLEDHAAVLDDQGKRLLEKVRRATQTMGLLIEDLLNLARVARAEIRSERVDLSALAAEVAAELKDGQPDREVDFVGPAGLVARGDRGLLRLLLENLLANAWKFTSKKARARIEFGATQGENGRAYFVRDDGVGFDMQYADKLFGAFQRLHHAAEFPGTGIGLATCARIVHRHGGLIWAESEPGTGATFFFTLERGET